MAKTTKQDQTVTRRELAALSLAAGAVASGPAAAQTGLALDKRLAGRRTAGAGKRNDHRERAHQGLPGAHRGLRSRGARPQFGARAQSRLAVDRRPPRWREANRSAAAHRRADPGEGQYRHRRQAAHDRGLARPRGRSREGRFDGGEAPARRGRGDSGQGQPHRVRQHPRDRHAVGLQLAGRPGEEPLFADADGRSRHPGRAARRIERRLGGRGRRRPVRRGDRQRDFGLAAQPRQPERPGHGEAHGRADQPRRHPADLAQPGHGRPPHPHRARLGNPAERAGRKGSARRGDAADAAAGRLHRRARQGRAEGRAHRPAERFGRSAQ